MGRPVKVLPGAEAKLVAETRSCFGCGRSAAEPADKCPKCGRRLLTAKQVRRLGWVQFAAGLFLVGMMGAVTYYVAPMMLRPGVETAGGSRFTGTAGQALTIFVLFGLVIFFGLTSMVSGLYQVKTGRRNRLIFVFMMGLFGVLLVAGWLIPLALGD